MVFLPLSLPHRVLSSWQTLDGDISLHVLTPFGHMDISFSAMPPEKESHHAFDILVEGDDLRWLLDGMRPGSFRKAIVGFVGHIALLHSGRPVHSSCELTTVFRYDTGDITLTGHLAPYAFASADG